MRAPIVLLCFLLATEYAQPQASGSIENKYKSLGGSTGVLGPPLSPEMSTPDGHGRFRHYRAGSIFLQYGLAPHEVHGAIRDKWAALGWERGVLGYPTSDEIPASDNKGRLNHFQGGAIYWAPDTGAHEVHGEIHEAWVKLGAEKSQLGYPVSDERRLFDRIEKCSYFKHGAICWTPAKATFVDPTANDPGVPPPGPAEHPTYIPGLHSPYESDAIPRPNIWGWDRRSCVVHIHHFGYLIDEQAQVDGWFPEYTFVEPQNPVQILEGQVVGPDEGVDGAHVSYEELPSSHYTHDFTFHVRPDATSDHRFTNLLAQSQDFIEVEWETGLGADNDDNACSDSNRQGGSCGFFSAGHPRRGIIWHWPTVGDYVHVEGFWVWDRGHTPVTEIHPPRLVVVRRKLPEIRPVSRSDTQIQVLATRVDIFASSDGGALWNNRNVQFWTNRNELWPWMSNAGSPSFPPPTPVRVHMGERDYSFPVDHPLPRPSSSAQLRWQVVIDPSMNSFPVPLLIQAAPDGDADRSTPHVHVTVPWQTGTVADDRVLAQTIFLYWDEGHGVPLNYRARVFSINLQSATVNKTTADEIGDAEYRLFAEVGGKWLFVNELVPVADILRDGLGDTGGGGQEFSISRPFEVVLPPDDRTTNYNFRVFGAGWEADGSNEVFGQLIDPYVVCDAREGDGELEQKLNDNLFSPRIAIDGCNDDPIGEVQDVWSASRLSERFGRPDVSSVTFESRALGGLVADKPESICGRTDTNDSFRLRYNVSRQSLPWSTSPVAVTVTFLSFRVDGEDGGHRADAWLDLAVNGEHQRFPPSGTRNLGLGSEVSLPPITFNLNVSDSLRVAVRFTDENLSTSITIPADETITGRPQTITQDKFLDLGAYYDSANNFGRGSYSPRSSSASTDTGGEFFEIRYRIDAREINTITPTTNPVP